MQRSSTILVLRMKVGTFVQEAAEGRHLFFGIPRGTADKTVRRVVQGVASAVICRRVRVGAGREQKSNDLDAITGGGQMQRRVARVDPMKNL